MNRVALVRLNRPQAVHGLAQHIHHAPERRAAHRDGDRSAQRNHLHATHNSFGRRHCNGAHAPFAQMLRDFRDDVDRPDPRSPSLVILTAS